MFTYLLGLTKRHRRAGRCDYTAASSFLDVFGLALRCQAREAPPRAIYALARSVLTVFIVSACCWGQQPLSPSEAAVGIPNASAYVPVELGSVDLATGNLHLSLPLGSFKQRGSVPQEDIQLTYDSQLYTVFSIQNAGTQDYIVPADGSCESVLDPSICRPGSGGWRLHMGPSGTVFIDGRNDTCPSGNGPVTHIIYDKWRYTEPNNTVHPFNIRTQTACNTEVAAPTGAGYATDGSGYYMSVVSTTQATVYAPNGDSVYPTYVDTNGNATATGSTLTVGPQQTCSNPMLPGIIQCDSTSDEMGTKPFFSPITQNADGSYTQTINIRDNNGSYAQYIATYRIEAVHTDFQASYSFTINDFSGQLLVLESIDLPNGTSYTFTYDEGSTGVHYGTLESVKLPSGATVAYAFGPVVVPFENAASGLVSSDRVDLRLTQKTTSNPSSALNISYLYTPNSGTDGSQVVTVTSPLGDDTVYSFPPLLTFPSTVQYYSGRSSGGSIIKSIAWQNPSLTPTGRTVTLKDGSSATTTYQWNHSDTPPSTIAAGTVAPHLTRQRAYDFDGTLVKETDINYWSDDHPAYLAAHITDRVESEVVLAGTGAKVAETDYSYDDQPLATSSGSNEHDDQNFGSSTTVRGNLTTVKQWVSASSYNITQFTYNTLGQRIAVQNPRTLTTSYSYADAWASSTDCTIGSAGIYPTSTVNPIGETTKTTYWCTGRVATTSGPNDLVAARTGTSAQYDSVGRIVALSSADGSATTYQYEDTSLPIKVIGTVNGAPSPDQTTTSTYDGLGRVVSQASAASTIDTTYDADGRVHSVSNPYDSSSSSSLLTVYQYDALGRVISTVSPDGTHVDAAYNGRTEDRYDALSLHSRLSYDALGRMTQYLEPDEQQNVPTLETDYSYDSIGNLVDVLQKGHPSGSQAPRHRTFSYDGLSELLTATNPESGTICYGSMSQGTCVSGYDGDGNLTARTDANGHLTTYTFDSLDRLTNTTYADGTPPVSFKYGSTGAIANGIDLLTEALTGTESAPVTHLVINQRDAGGRIQSQTTCVLQQCSTGAITQNASYDAAGQLVSLSSNPTSGATTFTRAYDGAGRVISIKSSVTGDTLHPDTIFTADPGVVAGTGYGPAGLLVGAYGVQSASGSVAFTRTLTYDSRNRVMSDIYNGGQTTIPASSARGVINIAPSFGDMPQSKLVPGTPTTGTGTATLAGAEGSYQICQSGTSCRTRSDTGTISISVGGFVASTTYDTGSSAPSLATSLGTALSSSSSPVIASVQGSTITVTSKATGTPANLSFSWSGTIAQGGCSKGCKNTSDFTIALSGSALNGGGDGSHLVYDSGSITASVGTVTVSVPWGQGSTAETIASSLASAISGAAGDIVSVTTAGSTIALTTIGAGNQANTPIAVSVTFDSSDFPTSSFTATASGLSGGIDAHPGPGVLYSYSVSTPGNQSGYSASSDVIGLNDSVMGQWSLTYDNLDRLLSGSLKGGPLDGLTLLWDIDDFGNRRSQQVTAGPQPPQATPTYTFSATSTNRPDQTINSFDQAGQQTADSLNTYRYDSEGRICAAQLSSASGANIVGYLYDFAGNRVAKGNLQTLSCDPAQSGFTPTQIYTIGFEGEEANQLDGLGNWQQTGVSLNGSRLATYDSSGLHFQLSDMVGTKRAQASGRGELEESCVSLPYGDNLMCTVVQGGEASALHFAGHRRDADTLLDYFLARYYSSGSGRFLSPDYNQSGGKPQPVPYARYDDPQSLNLYAYVLNNPLSAADADGHDCDPDTSATTAAANGDIRVDVKQGGCHFDISFLLRREEFTRSAKEAAQARSGPAPSNVVSNLKCAAKYGSQHSIASALGLGNNYVANLFGSNSVSGLVNLGLSISGNGGPPDFLKMALGGASLGLPINNIRTFTGGGGISGLNGATGYLRGQALQGIFNAATEAGGISSIAAEGGTLAAQGGLTAGEFASGVGIAKFGLDLGTFLVGYYSCATK